MYTTVLEFGKLIYKETVADGVNKMETKFI